MIRDQEDKKGERKGDQKGGRKELLEGKTALGGHLPYHVPSPEFEGTSQKDTATPLEASG
ncbi:hypothetical protein VTH82DRAFT_8192 [Thermothelomyces myriococcoides]